MTSNSAVADLLERYFAAFRAVDVGALEELLHERCRVFTRDDEGNLAEFTRAQFLRIIGGFNPPQGADANAEVLGIDLISTDAGVARVRLTFAGTVFTDILNLMRLAGRWHVVTILDAAA
jgi:hypothetical protein